MCLENYILEAADRIMNILFMRRHTAHLLWHLLSTSSAENTVELGTVYFCQMLDSSFLKMNVHALCTTQLTMEDLPTAFKARELG